jgi:hypothetical protein
MKSIISYNISVLDQLKDLLSKIYPVEYTLAIPLLYNSSLGKHTRHIIEFYICFFEAQKSGLINYDARKRDLKLETDVDFVIDTIEYIKLNLTKISSDAQWQVTSEMPHDMGFHTGVTTLSRELNYLADHTVHHLALIKIGTNLLNPQIKLADNFGVAASTINYQK